MGKLDGRPTLILIEEAWMAFNSTAFSKQLDEWLKTLRKLNVYIVMVTLQIGEILNSPIKTTLLNQCATRLYTPNPDLDSQEVYDTYKEFGLNNKQIEILKNAKMKSEYYISNNDGDRLFNLDMMYFDEDTLAWAQATGEGEEDENKIIHRDVNGVILATGDSVVLIKDLKVKGSSMVAKQGTSVRNIRLDHENAEYIEGRVDGQTIVIITQYVKKL